MGPEGMVQHGMIDVVVGTIFVLFNSANRFNTPSTNRSSTTAGRYFLALALYCLAATVTYFLLVNFPHLVTFLVQGDPQALPTYLKELSNPLVMALLLTALLPKLPVLSTMDKWILGQLQDMAAIPGEVRRLSAELRKQPLAVAPGIQVDVRRKLTNEGFDERDVCFDCGEQHAELWTALTTLLFELESWESDRKMVGYITGFNESLDRIKERYQALIPKAKTCFRLLRQAGASDETDKAREAVERYAEDFSEQVTSVKRDLLDFISRGVLASELTDTARAHRLEALGFPAVVRQSTVLTLNQMMSLFAVVGILVLSSLGMFAVPGTVSQGVLLARAIMISLIYSVAVACVVIPRQRWKFAKWEPGRVRPVAFYIGAGLLSVTITQVISFGFNWVLARSLEDGIQRYLFTYPWSVMTFTTSVVTAFLIDNPPPTQIPRVAWRMLEGTIGAGTMVVAAVLTHRWLLERLNIIGPEIALRLEYFVPPRAAVLVPAAAVGFAIGYLVPAWFREAPRAPAAVPINALSGAV
jgi:hypothetical protein